MFTRDVCLDREVWIKFCKSSASGSRVKNFVKDSSTLQDRAFVHYLVHIPRETDKIFMKISQTYLMTRKSLLNFEVIWIHLGRGLHPPNSAFHPSGVGKWLPASARKAKAGMVHSISRCTQGVQEKLRDPLRTCAIPECLTGVFMTRHYTNPSLRLPLPPSALVKNGKTAKTL